MSRLVVVSNRLADPRKTAAGGLAVALGETLNATGGLADITLPDGERAGQTARTTLFPLRMDGQRLGVRLQPPTLGAHTQELLAQLGYAPDEVQSLRAVSAVL